MVTPYIKINGIVSSYGSPRKGTDALRHKESRIAEIAAALEETFESLSEEDKEDYGGAFNDDGVYIKSAVIAIAKKELQSLLRGDKHG